MQQIRHGGGNFRDLVPPPPSPLMPRPALNTALPCRCQMRRPVDLLAQLIHDLTGDVRQGVPPLPAAAAQHGQRWRLEACGALFGALHRVLYACWQRLEGAEEAEEEGQEECSKCAAGGKPDGSEGEEEEPQDPLELAAYLLERVQNAWGATCCTALRPLVQAGPPGRCAWCAARCWGLGSLVGMVAQEGASLACNRLQMVAHTGCTCM